MTKITQRTNIGPSAHYTTKEDDVQIATETSFVEDEQGIRRVVAKGSRIPAYLRLDTKGEDVKAHDTVLPIVDEDAARPAHEREGQSSTDPGDQRTTKEQVEESAALSGRKQQRQSGGSAKQQQQRES